MWVYVPVIRSRLCDVPSFTAQCLLLPVALSRDHEHNGVRIKNRAERSEQTERSVGSYFVSVSLLMRIFFLFGLETGYCEMFFDSTVSQSYPANSRIVHKTIHYCLYPYLYHLPIMRFLPPIYNIRCGIVFFRT